MIPFKPQIVVQRLPYAAHGECRIVRKERDEVARVDGEGDRRMSRGRTGVEIPALLAHHHQIVRAAAGSDVEAEGAREHHAHKATTAVVRIRVHQRLVAVVAQGKMDGAGGFGCSGQFIYVGRGFEDERCWNDEQERDTPMRRV